MNNSGIYKIQSKIKPRRIYIGSAIDIKKRWWHHLSELRLNRHINRKLQGHFNKYGEIDLQFSILLGCDKEDLIKSEQFFIDILKPSFNICSKAGSLLGFKHSIEFCKKQSKNRKGRVSPMKGKHHSEESKTKMRKPMSEQAKQNMSKAQILIGSKPPSRKGKNGFWKGKKLSKEHCLKLSESHKGQHSSPNTEFKKKQLTEAIGRKEKIEFENFYK
jgi:group I intron endonuclease